jgi:DNA-binding beta-propeller fold protein YncE
VLVFDAQGKFLKNIAIPGRGGSYMAADGTFYISDVNSGAVAVLKNDQIVDFIKVEGRPHGLAVDAATGDVYTSSTVATRPGVTKASPRRTAGASN